MAAPPLAAGRGRVHRGVPGLPRGLRSTDGRPGRGPRRAHRISRSVVRPARRPRDGLLARHRARRRRAGRGSAYFDEDDLAAAVDGARRRYAAGEGAEHAEQRAASRARHWAIEAKDRLRWRVLGDAPGFAVRGPPLASSGDAVARREFSRCSGPTTTWTSTLHRDEVFCVVERCSPGSSSCCGRTPTLAPMRVEQLSTASPSMTAGGRLRRTEYFDADDWDAALARFDELSATPVDPRNSAGRERGHPAPCRVGGAHSQRAVRRSAGSDGRVHFRRGRPTDRPAADRGRTGRRRRRRRRLPSGPVRAGPGGGGRGPDRGPG